MVAPGLYRQYAAAAFAALRATGHTTARDTILIGELAPEGKARPARRLADLRRCASCARCTASTTPTSRCGVPPRRREGCPASGGGFVAANPALFTPTGFAHHPYSFFRPPRASLSDPNWAPLADLGRLEHALDRTLRRLRRRAHAAALPDRVRLRDQPAEPVPRRAAGHPGRLPRRRPAPGRRRPAGPLDVAVPALRRRARTPRSPAGSQALLVDVPDRPAVRRRRAEAGARRLRAADRHRRSPTSAPAARSQIWGMLRPAANFTAQTARCSGVPAVRRRSARSPPCTRTTRAASSTPRCRCRRVPAQIRLALAGARRRRCCSAASVRGSRRLSARRDRTSPGSPPQRPPRASRLRPHVPPGPGARAVARPAAQPAARGGEQRERARARRAPAAAAAGPRRSAAVTAGRLQGRPAAVPGRRRRARRRRGCRRRPRAARGPTGSRR